MPRLSLIIDASGARAGASEFSRATGGVVSSAGQADRSVRSLDRGIAGLGRNTGSAAATIGRFFGAFAAFSIVRQAAATIAGFEETLATVRAVTQATEADFGRLSQAARDLGATTRFSAQEAGEAELFLARAGFDVNQTLAALPATLNLAAAGQLGLGEAADIASNAISAFNLEAQETGRVADILVNTANSSNTSVRQLAEALKFVAPVAGALGRDIEETSAALGALGDSGIQASLAGTNLRGILSGLLGPTAAAMKALDSLGLSLDDVDPDRRDLPTIFQRFADANLGAAAAVDIFGRRNAAAALVLTSSVDKLRELTDANRTAAGEAERNARVIEDTLAGAFRSLRSTVEEAILRTGDEGFGAALRGMVETARDAVKILFGFADAQAEANTSAQVLAVAIETLTVALAAMAAVRVVTFLVDLAGSLASAALAAGRFGLAIARLPFAGPIALLASFGAGLSAVRDALSDTREEARSAGEQITTFRDQVARLEAERTGQAGRGGAEFSNLNGSVAALEGARARFNRATGEENIGDRLRAIEQLRDALSRASEQLTKELEQQGATARTSYAQVRQLIDGTNALLGRQSQGPIGVRGDSIVNERAIRDIDAANESLKALETSTKAVATARQRDIDAEVSRAAAAADARQAINDQIATIQLETRELGLNEQQRFALAQRVQADAQLSNLESDERGRAVRRLADAVSAYNRAADAAAKLREEQERSAEAERRRVSAEQGVSSFIAQLERERQLLDLKEDQRAAEEALDVARRIAAQGGLELTEQQIESIRRLAAETERLRNAQGAASTPRPRRSSTGDPSSGSTSSVLDDLRDRQLELDRLRLGDDAFRDREFRVRATAEFEGDALLGIIDSWERVNAAIAEQEGFERRKQALRQFGDEFGRALSDPLADFLTGISSAEDALGSFLSSLSRLSFDTFIGGPLQAGFSSLAGGGSFLDGFSSLFSAKGNAFSAGQVVPFAQGAVFDSPIAFPLRDGRTGIGAEAGPEGLLPLGRDSQGRLGVHLAGGGGGGSRGGDTYNIRVAINAPNVTRAAGLMRAGRQIADDIGGKLGR